MQLLTSSKISHISRADATDNYRYGDPDFLIDFSSFNELEASFSEQCVSVKYLATGTEAYTINGKQYQLQVGNYLLLNGVGEGKVLVDSETPAKGICFAFSRELIAEIIAGMSLTDPERSGFCEFLQMEEGPESLCRAQATKLGGLLTSLRPPEPGEAFSKEQMFRLAEHMLLDQLCIYKYFSSLHSVRPATRKELITRLMKGKEFIDSYYTSPLDVATIASKAHLSEYYFLRLFKQMFRQSPYHYLLEKRLNYAAELLRSKDLPILEVAYSSGFSDIYRFSKSFKKRFGQPPSLFRKNNRDATNG